MKTVTVHEQKYGLYTWDDFGNDVFELAQKITASGEHFDRIIGLAKGGIIISRPMADLCDIHDMSSIQVEFYTGIGETKNTPVITQSLPVSIRDESILILDDLADSGDSLQVATSYLKHHGTKDMKTATLFKKPWSKVTPTFYCRDTNTWVIFPWEVRETIEILNDLWSKRGDSFERVTHNLERIGFSQQYIETFLPKQQSLTL